LFEHSLRGRTRVAPRRLQTQREWMQMPSKLSLAVGPCGWTPISSRSRLQLSPCLRRPKQACPSLSSSKLLDSGSSASMTRCRPGESPSWRGRRCNHGRLRIVERHRLAGLRAGAATLASAAGRNNRQFGRAPRPRPTSSRAGGCGRGGRAPASA
jgi:hypothetical protein